MQLEQCRSVRANATAELFAAETNRIIDLAQATPQDLRRFMNSDAGLTPEQQLHRSAWSLANAVRKGKQLSQEELESVIDKFSRMLSTRSDYDEDASEFMTEQRRLELDNAPPAWLPALMQEKLQAEDRSADLQNQEDSSRLAADSAHSQHESKHPGSPPSHELQQWPSDSTLSVVDAQGIRLDDILAGSEADQKDINLLLDPGLDEAFDVASWPMLNKPSHAGQQTSDKQQPRIPEEVPATTQTSPIARHLQSTGDTLPHHSKEALTRLWISTTSAWIPCVGCRPQLHKPKAMNPTAMS